MKKVESIEVYTCDCCGAKSLYSWRKYLEGGTYNSTGAVYEPIVLGDYCDDCRVFAQDDWDLNGKEGFTSERYDVINKDMIEAEIEAMKLAKDKNDELEFYGNNYR